METTRIINLTDGAEPYLERLNRHFSKAGILTSNEVSQGVINAYDLFMQLHTIGVFAWVTFERGLNVIARLEHPVQFVVGEAQYQEDRKRLVCITQRSEGASNE